MMRRKKKVVVFIDQATRDAFGQRLVVEYLRHHGVSVTIANHGTLIPACQRIQPDVVYSSWLPAGGLMEYLASIHHRTQIVLIDQEAAKIGEQPFKRSFSVRDGGKRRWKTIATKLFVWGPLQKQWILDLDVAKPEQIVVTGSPKLDPYLVPRRDNGTPDRHLGLTFRFDHLTGSSEGFMESLWSWETRGLNAVGYPTWAQEEDRMWHNVAAARYMFKLLNGTLNKFKFKIVVRPGPWEKKSAYRFLHQFGRHIHVDNVQAQHVYVQNAFAVIDDCSSFGVEALVTGVPVISIQRLIPRLQEHMVGEGGGLYSAPYMQYYWKPETMEEALSLIEKASANDLASTPTGEGLGHYLQDLHQWPRARPAAFLIGDAILELLDTPPAEAAEPSAQPEWPLTLKRCLQQYVPGALSIARGRMLLRMCRSKDREHQLRYHYFDCLYSHHQLVQAVFRQLLETGHAAVPRGRTV